MNQSRALRAAAGTILATGAFMAAASGASARTTAPSHARAVRGAISLFRRSLPAALSTDLLPQTNGANSASSKGQVSINLFTNPVPLTIQGLTYQMTMAAYGQTNTFANPPQVEIGLDRLESKPGRGPVAAQQHAYAYASTGIQFSVNSDVSKLRLNTGSTLSPTVINTTFTKSAGTSSPCKLVNGGRGNVVFAQGAMTSSAFSVHTGTSPFFGDITTQPTGATVFTDPGCASDFSSGGGSSIFGGGGHKYVPTCSGQETLVAGSFFSATQWAMERGFHGGQTTILAGTSSQNSISAQSHLAISLGPARSLPMARIRAAGTTINPSAAGAAMFSGGATFFSHKAPHVSTVQRCTYERHTYRYVAYRYSGGMKPAPNSPYTVLFDTGHLPFHARSASLTIRKYRR